MRSRARTRAAIAIARPTRAPSASSSHDGLPPADRIPLDFQLYLPPAPASGPDGNYPLVVFIHGWEQVFDRRGHRGRVRFLCAGRLCSARLQRARMGPVVRFDLAGEHGMRESVESPRRHPLRGARHAVHRGPARRRAVRRRHTARRFAEDRRLGRLVRRRPVDDARDPAQSRRRSRRHRPRVEEPRRQADADGRGRADLAQDRPRLLAAAERPRARLRREQRLSRAARRRRTGFRS